MGHPENYKYYLNITRYNTIRMNIAKYQEYLDAKKYYEEKNNNKQLRIKRTVTP